MIDFLIFENSLMYNFFVTTSRYRTELMGLAMISIMLFHQYFISTFPFNVFHNFGNWGVDIFLFLSGMGLVNSLNNNSLKTYYSHRFYRIIPSCILCGSLKYLLFLLLGQSVAILKDGLKIGIWSIISFDLWFIPAIIILYAISPLLYNLLEKWTYITITLVLLLFFINGFFIRSKVGNEWMSPIGIFSWTAERLPVFVAGMYVVMNKKWIEEKISYLFPFIIAAISIRLMRKAGFTFQGIQACQYITLAMGMPALISICTTIFQKMPDNVLYTIRFFGMYSLELYLVHEFIFWSLIVNFNNINPFFLLTIGGFISCFSAYLCKLLIEMLKIIPN